MLLNLLTNAVKFSHTGVIEVEAFIIRNRDKNYFLDISVRDQGIGMTKEETMNVFTPFFFLKTPRS